MKKKIQDTKSLKQYLALNRSKKIPYDVASYNYEEGIYAMGS
jgi:hypothetical protein